MRPIDRRGFVLPLTLAALMLVGILVTGLALTARAEVREGADAMDAQRAASAARLGLLNTLLTWNRDRHAALAVGAAAVPDTLVTAGGALVESRLVRTGRNAWWIESIGMAHPAQQPLGVIERIGVSLRADLPVISTPAVLTVRGPAEVRGFAAVSGTDGIPAGWSGVCPVGGVPDIAGVAAPDTALVCGGAGCASSSAPWISGTPAELESAVAADPRTYDTFGDLGVAVMHQRADITLPGGTYTPAPAATGGACTHGTLNWGDPARAGPCADHYPVVHITGNVTLDAGSAGQGILVVDGSVVLDGPVTFVGVIIAGDDIVTSGPGVRVWGRVLAANIDPVSSTRIDGDARLQFAACALDRALIGASPLVPVRGRPWVTLR
ncbi:MAG TPA: hypothetical protein VFG84_01645 [Gemmatimonadaceae bacterium]|nr:hypothetical protein [Gemmatimonadaceae bacterium]